MLYPTYILSKFCRKVSNSSVVHYAYLNLVSRVMSSSSSVIIEDVGHVGVITLNRPKALNALNLEMIRIIYPQLKKWEHNKSLVIMKGSGEKAFCAGGDVVAVTEAGKKGGSLTKDFFREEYLLNCLIGTYNIPYIAFINGITMGGGVGLSVHGMYRVATEKTLFAMPETAIGLFPDVGGSHFLPRLKGNLGIFLALTGYRLKGCDTLRAGIATHLCSFSQLSELESSLLKVKSSEEMEKVLQKFSDSATFDKDTEFSLKNVSSQISSCFGENSVEDIINTLEKDGSEWARKQIQILNTMSPTSLKISLEILKKGKNLTLPDCLAMEYRLTQRCCADHDFYEGVRAVLLDKDNNPKWQPSQLEEVTKEIIDKYFARLPDKDELVF